MGEQEEMIKDIFKTGVQIIKEMKEKDQTTEETKEKEKTAEKNNVIKETKDTLFEEKKSLIIKNYIKKNINDPILQLT